MIKLASPVAQAMGQNMDSALYPLLFHEPPLKYCFGTDSLVVGRSGQVWLLMIAFFCIFNVTTITF